jgi:hypothetical protein
MDTLVLAGEVILFESEGGFANAAIEVDGEGLDVLLARYVGVQPAHNERGHSWQDEMVSLGRLRITVHVLEPIMETRDAL